MTFDATEFPRLNANNHRVTSPESADYNCVAWAAGDSHRWWQPGVCWPGSTEGLGLESLEAALRSLGYEPCPDGDLENGFEKVAVYSSGAFFTHVARQLASGKWTSKIGQLEDIEHDDPEVLAGGAYGRVESNMRRARAVSAS